MQYGVACSAMILAVLILVFDNYLPGTRALRSQVSKRKIRQVEETSLNVAAVTAASDVKTLSSPCGR